MDYTLYQAEDFAADESFISYYLKTDKKHFDFWELWIAQHPEKQSAVSAALGLLDMVHVRLSSTAFEAERSKMLSFLENSAVDKSPAKQAVVQKLYRKQWIAAASILIICAIGVLFLFKAQRPIKPTATKWLTTLTAPGEKRSITLTDGTHITLNGNSQLRYPAEFQGNDRKVEFSGEGFFEVAKDAAHPFKIKSGRFLTTVLGTQFNLNTGHGITVSLTEGKIKLTTPGIQPVILLPGYEAYFTEHAIRTRSFDTTAVLDWKLNRLVFKQSTFTEIADKMYRAYGIVLISRRPLKWAYTGQFERTDYRSVLSTITYSKNLQYIVKHDTVIIK